MAVLIEMHFKLKSHNEAIFCPVQYFHSAEGGLYRGAYNRMYFFCFQVDLPITRGGLYKCGGGGSYNQNIHKCMS